MSTFSGICDNCIRQPVEIEFKNARVMTCKDDSQINVVCFQCTTCGQDCVSPVIDSSYAQRYILHGAQHIHWAREEAPYGGRLSRAEVQDIISVYLDENESAATDHFGQEYKELCQALNGMDSE